mgnify:CR=1 FL=1
MRAVMAIAEEIGAAQWAHFDAVVIVTLIGELTSQALIGISPTNPVTHEPSVMVSVEAIGFAIDSATWLATGRIFTLI